MLRVPSLPLLAPQVQQWQQPPLLLPLPLQSLFPSSLYAPSIFVNSPLQIVQHQGLPFPASILSAATSNLLVSS